MPLTAPTISEANRILSTGTTSVSKIGRASCLPISRPPFDVALGVVEVETGLRINALDRADHLRGEQDIVDRHHFGEQDRKSVVSSDLSAPLRRSAWCRRS